MAVGKNNTCAACQQPVGFAERVAKLERVFHADCYKCQLCQKKLQLGRDMEHGNKYYCQTCYKKKFEPKQFGYGVEGGDNLEII